EQRRDENRHGNIAALELRRKIDLRREPVDDAVTHIHQYHAERGVDQVQSENRQLHSGSSCGRSVPRGRRTTGSAGFVREGTASRTASRYSQSGQTPSALDGLVAGYWARQAVAEVNRRSSSPTRRISAAKRGFPRNGSNE